MTTPQDIKKIFSNVKDCKINDMYVYKSENKNFNDNGYFLIIEVKTDDNTIKKFSIGGSSIKKNNRMNFNVYDNNTTIEIENDEQIENDKQIENDELINAIKNKDFRNVKKLLENGANVHYLDESPLKLAADNGYYQIINLLIDFGADYNSIDKYVLNQALQIK